MDSLWYQDRLARNISIVKMSNVYIHVESLKPFLLACHEDTNNERRGENKEWSCMLVYCSNFYKPHAVQEREV